MGPVVQSIWFTSVSQSDDRFSSHGGTRSALRQFTSGCKMWGLRLGTVSKAMAVWIHGHRSSELRAQVKERT